MAEIVAEYKLNVDNAVTELRKVADATEGTQTQLNKTEQVSKKVTTDMGGQFKKLGGQIAAAFGITAVIATFVMAVRGAFNAAKDFEQQMSKVRAISGATNAEMVKLEKSAKQLGATTMFTATQVGELQEAYARLGFTTKEILAATAATLDLAAATGSTLAEAADVAGSTVRGFGLDASETVRVTDVMALSFSKTGLGMSSFAEAMKMVAPVAKIAGISIETTTAMLGKLADANLRGSLAGTALRNLLGHLADANSDLSKQLGFSVKNADDLFRAFKLLQKGNIDLTAATELTDKRSLAAFITLIDGIDTVEELNGALDNATGSTKRMAEIMQNNLAGSITKLSSAWEGFTNQVLGSQGALRAVVDLLTQSVQGWGIIISRMGGLTEEQAERMKMGFEIVKVATAAATRELEKYVKPLAEAGDTAAAQAKANELYANSTERLGLRQKQQKEVVTSLVKAEDDLKALVKNSLGFNKLAIKAKKDEIEQLKLRKISADTEVDSIEAQIGVYERYIELLNNAASANETVSQTSVRSISLLSDQLKTLKDELQNAEIGSAQFLRAITDLQAKMQELADAEDILLRFEIDDEDTSAQDTIVQAEYNKFKEIQRLRDEHLTYLDKSISDELAAEFEKIEAIEKAEKEARERKKAADEEAKMYAVQLMQESLYTIGDIYGSINQMAQQSADFEMQMYRKKFEDGLITREELDAKERQLQSESAQRAKDAATFNAIMGAAQAAINALASPGVPFPIALGFSFLAAASAGIQVAAIQSASVPQFEDGGRIGGKRHSQGGTVIEAEVDEFVVNRKAYLANTGLVEAINKGMGEAYIMRKWVAPAVDSALLNGWQDIGKSAELNNLTANLKDHNIIAAMDRNRQATTYGLKLLAEEIRATKRRGDRNTWH
jgi:TP901 family phage tail tape measure protein